MFTCLGGQKAQAQRRDAVRIKTDADGIFIEHADIPNLADEHVLWSEIVLVAGYKKDCFTVDQIRLEIQAVNDAYLVLTEDDEGFENFRESLAGYLPEMDTDWYQQLFSAPTFDSTLRVIYRRANRNELDY